MNEGYLTGHHQESIKKLRIVSPTKSPKKDDLDLSLMARYALNYLRGNPDPSRGYECKFALGPLGIPCHYPEHAPPNEYGYDRVSLGDTDCRMDWQYAHMREMSGEGVPDEVELGVRERILSYLKEDHLAWLNPIAYVGIPVEGTWATSWTSAKIMQSLSETYQRTREEKAKKEARSIFLALKNLALWDGSRAYYPGIAPFKDGQWLEIGWCTVHARNYPFIVEPCVRYWECTGDEEALDFACAVAEGFLAGSQKNQRELKIHPETGAFQGHVHLHTHAVWGVAHLGALLNNSRYLEWARKAYHFVLRNGTDYGWYPENLPQPEYRAEICVVGDMVSTGVWLARAGEPQYWDHVDRTVRNELRRSQFLLTPQFLDLFDLLHGDKPIEEVEAALATLRKLEGGFVAQPTFDDWVSYPEPLGRTGMNINGIHMMGCCPPEGMRGLWEAWNGVVEELPDGVFINLSIQRDHPAAKVTAHLQRDGRLDVIARRSARYFIRVPSWAVKHGVKLLRNEIESPVEWGGPQNAYLVCHDVTPDEKLTMTYGVPTYVKTFTALSVPEREETVTVKWMGNAVEEVEPHGTILPMFGRHR